MTHGANFDTGLTLIGNGGTHEENPLEGVPMGVDNEGTPNLVEEGEVIFNDYVFSNRLKVPKAVRKKYKLRGTKSLTFAGAALQMAKESEERPNDPISMRGMEVLMADLAGAQEELKARNRDNRFANGGKVNKFDGTSTVSNYTRNPNIDKPYTPDTVWVDLMGRQLRKRMEALRDMPAGKEKEAAIKAFYEQANKIQDSYYNDIFNSGIEWGGPAIKGAGEAHQKLWNDAGYNNYDEDLFNYWYTPRGISKDRKDTWVDNIIGDLTYNRHMGDGDLDARAYISLSGLAKELGLNYFYNDDKGGLLYFSPIEDASPANSSKSTTDKPNTSADKPNTRKDRYYIEGDDGKWAEVVGDNPYLDIRNKGDYTEFSRVSNDLNGNDLYYKLREKDPEYKKLPTWLRYTPTIGLGIAALTDAFGLTNKPDYGNAEAVLEASRGAGTYQPVRFNPIGNYLTYRPFDRDYYTNKLNAEAGATRRALLNTSGGNRGTAMAGILAADNNYLNQLGSLARQTEEYNLAQRQQVEDFNRGTNMTNSQGFLKADIANQGALAEARGLSLKGTMTAAEMRERARMASEQAKSANLSGLLTSLGDIGRENMAWNWRNFGLATGTFGNVGDEEGLLTNTSKKKSNGGKIKKRRGLTI